MAQLDLHAGPSCGELEPREGIDGGPASDARAPTSETILVGRGAVIDD